MLDDYLLRKWSRFIKVRDRGECQMCRVTPGAGRVQSHHIHPKAIFPDKAYDLANGVCLCLRCHKGVVHCELINDGGNWRRFVTMFQDLMWLQEEWNAANQDRIARPQRATVLDINDQDVAALRRNV